MTPPQLDAAASLPSVPICRDTAGTAPCCFAGLCSETRQRLQHYAPASLGGPLRGNACWAYLMHSERGTVLLRPRSDAQLEREAIASEGQP